VVGYGVCPAPVMLVCCASCIPRCTLAFSLCFRAREYPPTQLFLLDSCQKLAWGCQQMNLLGVRTTAHCLVHQVGVVTAGASDEESCIA
jgi:hypothetical protein